MSVSGTIKFQINLTNSVPSDLTTVQETLLDSNNQGSWVVTDGTTNGKMDRIWHDQRTLTASATDDLDVAGGLTNVLGQTITLARVKMLYIKAAAANTSTISVGAAGTNPISTLFGNVNDVLKVRPGGILMLVAAEATAYAITAGSADVLRITNDSGADPATYDIIIGGATA